MSWTQIEEALDGVLDRRWYTNQGPMARALERELESDHGVGHAVVATNPTIALVMLLEASGIRGCVGVAGTSSARCRHALSWAGLHSVDVAVAVQHQDCAAILLTPGGDPALASAQARRHGSVLLAVDVLTLGVSSAIRLESAGDPAGGGCVLTDDADLAARLRNIRSSYGCGRIVAVRRTANGRMSEIQAALCMAARRATGSDQERSCDRGARRSDERLREVC